LTRFSPIRDTHLEIVVSVEEHRSKKTKFMTTKKSRNLRDYVYDITSFICPN